ncbi:MAG: type II secretion system protein [Candidatus Sericytochromatia bacterium]|nr:type II secretion system protein [Candidatus Sericytochromatia bacterium]
MPRRLFQGRSRGFTMIELLVVIVIIGILAAVAIPNYAGAQDKSRNASVQSNMRLIQQAIEVWGADINHRYPAALKTAVEGHAFVGGGEDYLPNDTYPPTPWGTQQAAGTALACDDTPDNHVYASELGNRLDPVSTASFGAIGFSTTSTEGQYMLGGTGKRGNNPMRVLTLKNF